MESFSNRDFAGCLKPAVALTLGRESDARPPVMAERKVEAGGNGPGPVDAEIQRDGGNSTRVSGSSVDLLVDALLVALQKVEGRCTCPCWSTIGEAEHENVTILFTDLVGWTRTATRIDPETADRVLKRHFATLRSVVTGVGGQYVKSLGDGAMVVFRTASSALSCVVAMQRGIDDDNRTSSCPLGMRVGLSGGEVIRERGDYFGDPVTEAARLCAAADAGKIFVAQVVKDMAGRHVRHAYRTVGSLNLKGLPKPLMTLEVDWSPSGCHAITPAHASPTRRKALERWVPIPSLP